MLRVTETVFPNNACSINVCISDLGLGFIIIMFCFIGFYNALSLVKFTEFEFVVGTKTKVKKTLNNCKLLLSSVYNGI